MSVFIDRIARGGGKTLGPLVAIGCGILVPQAAPLAFLIQYLIMFMLFCSFIDLSVSANIFSRSIALLVVANVAIAVGVYFCLLPFDKSLALTGFITAISPTATVAPVIIGLIGGQVGYVVAAVLLTNVSIALLLPLLVSVGGAMTGEPTWAPFLAVLLVVFVPLLAAQGTRIFAPRLTTRIKRVSGFVFYVWMLVLFLATSNASNSIRTSSHVSTLHLLSIVGLSMAICVINFVVGYVIGRPRFGREASQALGQKNTMFTIWFSLTYLSPIVALGPTFYVIFHNLYNSYQLFDHSIRDHADNI